MTFAIITLDSFMADGHRTGGALGGALIGGVVGGVMYGIVYLLRKVRDR